MCESCKFFLKLCNTFTDLLKDICTEKKQATLKNQYCRYSTFYSLFP